MSEAMSRNDARHLFRETGATYSNLTVDDLRDLGAILDAEMTASGLFGGTFKMNKPIKMVDWPNGWAALTCRSYYFDKREAVTFNSDGFVGFGGWADDENIQPILSGFRKWCVELAAVRAISKELINA